MESLTPVDALKKAVDLAGSQSSLAKKLSTHRDGLNISLAQVWNWVNRGKGAPAAYCPDIEAVTGVMCEELQPGVNWAVLLKRKRKARA